LRSNPNRDGIPPAFSDSPVTKQHYLKKQLAFAKGTHPPSDLKLQRGIARKRARRKRENVGSEICICSPLIPFI
jgi:hypothetical protein